MALAAFFRRGDDCPMARKPATGETDDAADQLAAIGRMISRAREDAGVTQEGLAHETRLSVSQISRFESAKRRPYVDELLRIASVLKVPAAALLGLAEIPPIRVTGLVGAGALVETIEDPESWRSPNQVELHASGAIGALLVRGESQWPRFLDGEFILYDMEPRAPAELVNQYAVVQTLDGRRLIKDIHAAGGGKWELASHNAPPEIVELLAAWPYLGTIWGHDAKTPEIAPTKSKRAKKRA